MAQQDFTNNKYKNNFDLLPEMPIAWLELWMNLTTNKHLQIIPSTKHTYWQVIASINKILDGKEDKNILFNKTTSDYIKGLGRTHDYLLRRQLYKLLC